MNPAENSAHGIRRGVAEYQQGGGDSYKMRKLSNITNVIFFSKMLSCLYHFHVKGLDHIIVMTVVGHVYI